MRKYMKSMLTAAALLGFSLGQQASAQTPEDYKLDLMISDSQLSLGELVSVQVRLTNVSEAAVPVARFLAPDFVYVRYVVEGPDGRPYEPIFIKEHPDSFTELEPDGSIEEIVDLFYDARGWLFDRPGEYVVTAHYLDAVAAEPLRITITEPADARGEDASLSLLSSDEAGRYLLLRGGEHLKEGKAVVEEVARNGSGSQSAHAKVALATSLLSAERDFSEGTVREADIEGAAELYRSAAGEDLEFERLIEAERGLGYAMRSLNRSGAETGAENSISNELRSRFSDDMEALSQRNIAVPKIDEKIE